MKKVISLLLSFVMLLSITSGVQLSASAKTTSGGLVYTVSGSNVTITGYTGTSKTITVPSTIEGKKVTAIGERAFNDDISNIGYTSIKLPSTLKTIGKHSFSYCSALKSISIPNSVTSIGDFAFYGDEALATISISDNSSLKTIGSEAFGFCRALKRITIPKNVTSISDVFYFNNSLSEIRMLGKNTVMCEGKISKFNSDNDFDMNIKIYAYSGSKAEAYAKQQGYPLVVFKSYSSVALSSTSYTYNGKEKKPSVTVKDSKGNKIASSNYTVTYASGRKNVGKYTVTVTFKGNYAGTVKKTFTIKPKNTSISKLTAGKKKFTVKWKKQATQTTGYQIQYSTSSKFTSPKTVTVSKNSTTSKTISKLKGKKKYYVRIRTYKTVSGTKYYSAWSKAKSITTKK